jgi:uncharacterized protein (DUF1501 family)
MKRRDFIKTSAPLAFVPFFSNRLFAAAMPTSLVESALLTAPNNDRILVIVQLGGGNDGLNTVLPLDQYSNLAAARPNVLIPDTSALRLGSFQTGFHPVMTGMKTLYDQQRLTVVQNVGYTNPNFSHFRSTDIFLSGADSQEILNSGWVGRFLDAYPNPPAATNHPLALKIGYNGTSGLQGAMGNIGQTIPTFFSGSLRQLQSEFSNTFDTSTVSEYALNEVNFLQGQRAAANRYASSIQTAWNLGSNSQTYTPSPANVGNNLGNQLQLVARLIKGGLQTRVYWVEAVGYDTHTAQVASSTNTTQGNHANLLKELSNALFNFQTDLQLMGLEDRVLGMTLSEFGRRIKSNASTGTDHGTAAPMFLFGKYVNPTIIGSNPVIPATVTVNDNLPFQYDYRQIYDAVLRGWFCLSPTESHNVLLHNPSPLAALNTTPCAAVLPIELVEFTAKKANNTEKMQDSMAAVQLSWTTLNESNSSHFEIERSVDGKVFVKIRTLKAAKHAHSVSHYDWLDRDVPFPQFSVFYYRLKTIDTDQTVTISPVKSVSFDVKKQEISLEVSPNPSTDGKIRFILRGGINEHIPTEVTVTDLYGRLIVQKNAVIKADMPHVVSFDGGVLSSGVYILSCQNEATRLIQKIVLP